MSKRRMNNKGMPRVEIVIVLLIASIAMTITGGILINSLGYFQDTTELSTDKTTGDGLLDLIKSEIQYSTDVRVQEKNPNETTPGDWHCFYVDGPQLYNDDSAVFADENGVKGDYYNNRNLDITVKGFNNGYRLDMIISLNKGTGTNKETKYKVSHTFEFLNLKTKKGSNANFQNPLANIVNNDETLSSTMKLWYIKGADAITPDTDDGKKDDNNDTDSTGDGTVQDIINNINSTNYVGVYYEGTDYYYKKGSIIWYDNAWWEKVVDNNNNKGPYDSKTWKKLDKKYDAEHSIYERNDIVIYNDHYYKCITDNLYYQIINDSWSWEDMGSINDPDVVAQVKLNQYTPKSSNLFDDLVVVRYLSDEKYNSALKDPKKGDYEEFDANKENGYQKGDIVKKVNKHDSNFYDLWMAAKATSVAPGTPSSGWIKLDNIFDEGSSYLFGDMVYCGKEYSGGGNNWYIRAKQDVFVSSQPWIYGNGYWDYAEWKQ